MSGKDPRWATGPTLLDDVRDIKRRLASLEANRGGFMGSAVAIGGQIVAVKDSSLTDYTCAASPSAMETDTTLTISITPAVQSTLYIWCCGCLTSDTARQAAVAFQFILDDTTTTTATERFSETVVDMNVPFALMGHYTGVTAAAHSVKLQTQRINTADVVKILNRYILVLAIPE